MHHQKLQWNAEVYAADRWLDNSPQAWFYTPPRSTRQMRGSLQGVGLQMSARQVNSELQFRS
jgi:hypothetical protein